MNIKKIKINNILNTLKTNFAESLWSYLFKKSGTIVMTIFLLVSIASGFIIYKYLYAPNWNDARKEKYLKEKSQNNTNFNVKDFEKIIEKIDKRKEDYKKNEPTEYVNDIFRF